MDKHYHYGGDIYDFDHSIYVERGQDQVLLHFLHQSVNNKLAAIIGCRQTGKTSLARSLSRKLQQEQWVTVFYDLRDYQAHNLDSPKALPFFTKQFCSKLVEAFQHQSQPSQAAKQMLALIEQWYKGLTEDALISVYTEIDSILTKTFTYLAESSQKILLILDEFEGFCSVANDFEKFLTFIGRYINDPQFASIHWICTCLYRPSYDFIGLQPSKFPVKEFLLQEFDSSTSTLDQWSEGLTFLTTEQRRTLVAYTLSQTGGQPYLTARILDTVRLDAKQTIDDIDQIINSLLDEGDAHFDTCLKIIKEDHKLALRAIYAAIDLFIYDSPFTDLGVKPLLLSSGLVKESSNKQDIIIKCPIYKRFYHHQWFKKAITDCSMSVISEPYIQRVNKKKLLLINAGGTMGMEVDETDGTVREPTHRQSWLKNFPRVNGLAIIEYLEIFAPTDGANIGPKEWVKIADIIFDNRDSVDGVIVVHGTDTLAYTASAVAFALGTALPFPVVFTGSQAPYTVAHADAEINLLRACKVASLGEKLPEVVICFSDEVHRGVRAQKQNDFLFAGFHSPSFPVLARIGQSIKLNFEGLVHDNKQSIAGWQLENHFEHRVFRISQFPGLLQKDLMLLLEYSDIKGFVIESLGIGNLPTSHNEYYLNDFIKTATQKGIPVLISSKLPIAPEFLPLYSAASGPIQSGGIPTGNMTPAAALTKFMWVLAKLKPSQFVSKSAYIEAIKQAILRPIVAEVTPFDVENTESKNQECLQ